MYTLDANIEFNGCGSRESSKQIFSLLGLFTFKASVLQNIVKIHFLHAITIQSSSRSRPKKLMTHGALTYLVKSNALKSENVPPPNNTNI